MAIYVNGQAVNTCDGVYVNGQAVDNVYVNGVSAYQSRCAFYVSYSNDSLAPTTGQLDCGSAAISYSTGGFDVADTGFRRNNYNYDYGWMAGDWVWSGNYGLGIGITTSVYGGVPPIPYYHLDHDIIYVRNDADESCSVDTVNYDWDTNTFSGVSIASDFSLVPMGYLGDQMETSGNAIRMVHWVGCTYCVGSLVTIGDWCYTSQY